jgi:hypothetical protein
MGRGARAGEKKIETVSFNNVAKMLQKCSKNVEIKIPICVCARVLAQRYFLVGGSF